MSVRRALVVCPGRGSYDRASLGSLAGRSPAARTVIAACDAWRQANGRPFVTALDAAERYSSRRHVAGEHASLLTFACSLADLADLNRDRFEIVGVTGNSMGWYTALAASGALSLDDAVRLVDTMGAYQEGNVIGGQVLYPVVDDDWQPDASRAGAVDAAIASATAAGHTAEWSIRLGGYAVLGADAPGVKHLLQALPPIERGSRTFPVQLPLHSAFHTSLMKTTSVRAVADLSLAFRAPDVPLIDGRGAVFRPRWADPRALHAYTLGHQVTETYDLTTAIVSGLHHTGAEVVIVLGPGNSLGAPIAQILVGDRWGGARDKAAFARVQAETPRLLSFGVPEQRTALT